MNLNKNFIKSVFIILTLIASIRVNAEQIGNDVSRVKEIVNPISKLKHPGIFQSKEMIDEMCGSLKEGQPLRVKAWESMLAHKCGKIENSHLWKPESILVAYNNYNLSMAGRAANSLALQWIVTGEKKYANAAVEILNRWSDTLTVIKSKNDDPHDHKRLMGGIHMAAWANAGELLRYSEAPWSKADQNKFENMLRNVFLPALAPRPNHFNGNWDLACTKSTMAIAVFLNDRDLFDENIKRLKDGNTNGSIVNYLLPSGQTQESGRDQTHAQMGLEFLSQACEIAWHQGIDLYEYKGRSLGRCFEYLAKYNLGKNNLPFQIYPSPIGENAHDGATKISDIKRGNFNAIYESVYHHYSVRKGIKLEWVKKVLEQTRCEETEVWSTLIYGELKK